MGNRYILALTCPKCGERDDDVYFAPTCGFSTWVCKCGYEVDLEKLTGISYEDASNRVEIQKICDSFARKVEGEPQ